MRNVAVMSNATPARTPITMLDMAPPERCCEVWTVAADDDAAEAETDVNVGCDKERAPVPEVDCTTATPRAKPS